VTRREKTGRALARIALACVVLAAAAPRGWGGEAAPRSRGQTLYVPAYSHVFHGDRSHPFLLTATLVVRNADPEHPIRLQAVDYHGSRGEKIQGYVKAPLSLAPLSCAEYVVHESDRRGGAGAGFLVRWSADGPVVPPVVETVMIGTAAAQGISFVSVARVLEEAGE